MDLVHYNEWIMGLLTAAEIRRLETKYADGVSSGAVVALFKARGQRFSAATLRKAVSRMRQHFRQHVKSQIVPTLSEARDADEEMRDLLAGTQRVVTLADLARELARADASHRHG